MVETEAYQTPPGVAEQYVPLPPGYEHLAEQGYKAMNWHGHILIVGGDYGPNWLNEIEERKKNNESCIIAIVGPPGKGKSYFGLKLAEMFDKDFFIADTPAPPAGQDPSQLVYERAHFLYLCGNDTPLKRHQTIILDESQIAGGSRSWHSRDQQALMQQIESIRYRGYVVFLIVLHIARLDKILRQHVLSYMISMEAPGRGIVYRLFMPKFGKETHKKRLCTIQLPLPGDEQCGEAQPGCLECINLHDPVYKCGTIRALFERRKFEYLTRLNEEQRLRMEREGLRSGPMIDIDEALDVLMENQEFVKVNRLGNPDRLSIRAVLAEKGVTGRCSKDSLADIATRYAFRISATKQEGGS